MQILWSIHKTPPFLKIEVKRKPPSHRSHTRSNIPASASLRRDTTLTDLIENSDPTPGSGQAAAMYNLTNPFNTLPQEIRHMIWEEVLGGNTYHLSTTRSRLQGRQCTIPFFEDCRGVYPCGSGGEKQRRWRKKNKRSQRISLLLTSKQM
jgi:hypothetical protein